MKFINIKKHNKTHIGLFKNNKLIDLTQTAIDNNLSFPTEIKTLIENYDNVKQTVDKILKLNYIILDEHEIEFIEVVDNPEKILCVGLNYKDHKEEVETFSVETAEFPVVFNKLKNTLCGHKSEIKIPKQTKKLDYEVELVIIVGKECKDISINNATDYIFGYTIGNDLSARDLQMMTSQWLLGKTCDNFSPVGPCIVTKDELDINNLDIKCFVNGNLRQASNTCNMIFKPDYIVSYLSKFMTLKPGDLIFTGTPKGVILGYEEKDQIWLKDGDKLTLEIEGIGILENRLIN